MNHKNFRLKVLLRIMLILLLGNTAYYVITATPFWLLFCWLVLFALVGFFELIRFIEKSQRDLSAFLMAIKQNDFTNIYPEHYKKTAELYQTFNLLTHEFIKIRHEKETNFHFLKTVVEHSGVPLLSYDIEEEKVTLINESAKQLFHIPHLTKLDSLDRVNSDLLTALKELKSDEKILLKIEMHEEVYHLSIVAKELILQGTRHKVIAFHNINSELDQKEIESWQKLIRVLTHEIKNSVIPISTLTEVISAMLADEKGIPRPLQDLDEEEESDLRMAMKTIEKRSNGLVKFVSSYGDLAKVSKPQLERCNLSELIRQIGKLEKQETDRYNIKLNIALPSEDVFRIIDPEMIEQVLINLIKNAIEAIDDKELGLIEIKLIKSIDQISIFVKDNGVGMSKETLDNIFIPFFTTKESGSGIGLSLSRQIMRAHKGYLKVVSTSGGGSSFEIAL